MARTRQAAALSRQPIPRHARRVSGPVARPRPVPVPGQPRPRTPVVQPHDTFGATLRALPDHRLLDTLLRSRAWIWLLGVALGGIVFMQVSLLGMNAGIGRAVTQSTELEHANAQLRDDIARDSNGTRLQAAAEQRGLIMPSAEGVDYLRVRPGADASRAAGRLTPPSDTARANLAAGGVAPAVTTTAPAEAVTPAAVATAAPTPAPVVAATPVPTATVAPTAVPTATVPVETAAPTGTTPVVPATAAP